MPILGISQSIHDANPLCIQLKWLAIFLRSVIIYLILFCHSIWLCSSLTPLLRRYKLLVSCQCQHSSLTVVVSFSTGSGSCYWTTSSWSLTTTVLLSTVQMALFIGYFPKYSPTLLITLRSAWSPSCCHISLTFWTHRVLITTIHDMGHCPCPCCTIKKEDFGALGTTINVESHQTNQRHDDENFQATVQKAHDNIYQGGYALSSEPGVESLLREHSLVPTLVRDSISSMFMI